MQSVMFLRQSDRKKVHWLRTKKALGQACMCVQDQRLTDTFFSPMVYPESLLAACEGLKCVNFRLCRRRLSSFPGGTPFRQSILEKARFRLLLDGWQPSYQSGGFSGSTSSSTKTHRENSVVEVSDRKTFELTLSKHPDEWAKIATSGPGSNRPSAILTRSVERIIVPEDDRCE